jgi:hypothetical protein
VIRNWAECSFAKETDAIAGIVRDETGRPIEGAMIFFDDLSGQPTTMGEWRPRQLADSPEVVLRRSDKFGRFGVSREAHSSVRGVALLGVMAHGYHAGSVAWSLPPKEACVEFILAKQNER